MTRIQNFSEHLEKSLERIGQKTKENADQFEKAKISERSAVRESIRSIAEEVSLQEPAPRGQAPHPAGEHAAALPAYLSDSDENKNIKKTVERLIDMVFEEGLEHALRAAKKKGAFIEDAFHDALVDKLLPELKKRKIL